MKKIKESMEPKINAIIFDVGGVLFLVKGNRKEKHLLSSFREACLLLKEFGVNVSKSLKALFDIYIKSSRGDMSKEKTMNLMSKELGISPKKLEKLFRQVYRDNTVENKELYDCVLKLKKIGYKIGILSTQFHLSKDILIPEKYYQNFDALEISCEDKLRKPDKKAFKLILQRLKVKPEESVFVDDKQENLDTAEDLGMKTVLFKNNEQFFLDLRRLGIKQKLQSLT